MIEQMKIAYRYLLVMGAGLVLLTISTMVPVLSTNADFSIYNGDWNGCSAIGRDAYETGSFLPTIDVGGSSEESIMHESFAALRGRMDPRRSSLMIIGPEAEFTFEEGRFAHDFLASGGVIFLADDFGSGNDLLDELNTTSRFSLAKMMDISFMKKGEFSVTSDISEHTLTRGVGELMMNYPAVVLPSEQATPIVNSTRSSWIDIDEDGRNDVDEPQGPFRILTIEPYGMGTLVLLSDPSLLINQMRGKLDNDRLVANLMDYITANRTMLVIDESHRDLANPVFFMNRFVSGLDPAEKSGLVVGLILVFTFVQTPFPRMVGRWLGAVIDRLMRDEGPAWMTKEQALAAVLARHPEWNRRTLEQLISDLEDGV